MIILECENAFGLGYSFFREPDVTHFKMRRSTDTDSRLPIHQHTTQKLLAYQ